jgi:hypothetical protein
MLQAKYISLNKMDKKSLEETLIQKVKSLAKSLISACIYKFGYRFA